MRVKSKSKPFGNEFSKEEVLLFVETFRPPNSGHAGS
jgi:hypothetical protein